MKKILASALAVSAIFFATTCSALAVVEKDEGYVSVNISGTEEVAPDQAQITVSVETSDSSLQKAAADNKIISDKVYASLKSLLNTEKGDYIKTANYSANPVYTYTKDNKRVFDKYVVSNNVVVKTKNTALAAKLVDTAIATGATNVNDLQFLVADYDTACGNLMASLTKRAYAQANSIAGAVNAKVTGIKSIESSCNAESGSRAFYGAMAKSAPLSDSSTPIESGKVKVYASINASFYVK